MIITAQHAKDNQFQEIEAQVPNSPCMRFELAQDAPATQRCLHVRNPLDGREIEFYRGTANDWVNLCEGFAPDAPTVAQYRSPLQYNLFMDDEGNVYNDMSYLKEVPGGANNRPSILRYDILSLYDRDGRISMNRDTRETGNKIYPPQGPRRTHGGIGAHLAPYDADHPPPNCSFPEFIRFVGLKQAEATGLRYDSSPALKYMLEANNYNVPIPRPAQVALPKISKTFDSSTVDFTQDEFLNQLEEYFKAAGTTINDSMKIMKIKASPPLSSRSTATAR